MGLSIILFILTIYLTETIMKLKIELHKTCPLSPEACPYKGSIPIEAVAALVFVISIGIFGSFLTFTTTRA